MDCGRSADGSEVHVPESNGGDVGRGTVEFNLRGCMRERGDSVTATSRPFHCKVFNLLTVCKNGGGGKEGRRRPGIFYHRNDVDRVGKVQMILRHFSLCPSKYM